MDKISSDNLLMNAIMIKTYGEQQLLFLLWQPQDKPNVVHALKIRNGERTFCLVHYLSSNQTWVF